MIYKSTEQIYAKGKLFELVHTTQADGRVFEVARRASGVRLLIANSTTKQLLLSREYRNELGAWDYRLPGGKVFDTLDEFEAFRSSDANIVDAATQKAKAEASEEVGILVEDLALYRKSTLGATVEWDLYVFETTKWSMAENGQSLEKGEQIEVPAFYDYEKVEEMIVNGDMQEERIALIVLQWLRRQRS